MTIQKVADTSVVLQRAHLIRRGTRLEYLTIGYNLLESAVSLLSGLLAGSIALIGFGLDSLIEVTSAGAILWRLRRDSDTDRREQIEGRALKGS